MVIKDFAHAPAKVSATVEAVKEMYPRKNLIACLELHTFSSLNKDYVRLYNNTLKSANVKIVYVNQEILAAKKMQEFTKDEMIRAFGDKTLKYVTNQEELQLLLRHAYTGNDIYLMMSSGNFNGLDLLKVGK
jgi:UDP-N-acetylmuramate: L-alanyl-gamma-D-glutamyl-meso-diaminopimelate ligase